MLSGGPSLACKTSSFHACIDLPPVAIQGPWAAGQKAEIDAVDLYRLLGDRKHVVHREGLLDF